MERTFSFDFPVTKFPDLLERVRGTPARVEEMVRGVPSSNLTRRQNNQGWSIQENIGHLLDLGYLPMQRLDEILAGNPILVAADMSNRKTHEADHNQKKIETLLSTFRRDRAELVARFESLPQSDWGKSSHHPRLKKPMRVVDIAYFDSEHDDYHVARMRESLKAFA
ncbi:MAG: DinB family protein [Planctomycetota bacterium]